MITAFADKSFTFVLKSPPASVLIKKTLKLDKGSAKPLREVWVALRNNVRGILDDVARTATPPAYLHEADELLGDVEALGHERLKGLVA